MSQHEGFITIIQEIIDKLARHKQFAQFCDVDPELVEMHERLIKLYREILIIVKSMSLAFNYVNQFQDQISRTINLFALQTYTDQNQIEHIGRAQCRKQVEQYKDAIIIAFNETQFTLDFFRKLSFFSKNIVAVGANGSGKTSLANDLKQHLTQQGVVIGAQKILVMPTFSSISNAQTTFGKLNSIQAMDKTLRQTYSTEGGGSIWNAIHQTASEFQILLDNLLANRSAIWNKYCEETRQKEVYSPVPETNLDKVIETWNYLLTHRTLACTDGINLTLTPKNGGPKYPAHLMSDGEKVILYLVAQVLQAPRSGFIVVDEPEIYLHKTILSKLWDRLESERQDCIFIYLTHDLDFAVSRQKAKKVWIKSFNPPNEWEIEDIPANEIPEQLLLELLGSRRDILFCEGKKESLDTKVFEILFPQFTICPVASCLDVINHTKAFNRIPNTLTRALGIIDRDYHSEERLKALLSDGVYNYALAEIENLFLVDSFLELLAKQLLKDTSVVDEIKKDVVSRLSSEKELQISNYVSAKINYYFANSHVTKGRGIESIKANFQTFCSQVNIEGWYTARSDEITKIVESNDYSRALQIFNNKGLRAVAQQHFKLTDFYDISLTLLRTNEKARNALRSYFPNEFLLCD